VIYLIEHDVSYCPNLSFGEKMARIKNLFNNKSFQKGLMVTCIAIGAAGSLSGVWAAANGDPSYTAGLIGGIVTLGIGYSGLRGLAKGRAPAT
jgi:hypothetical protein